MNVDGPKVKAHHLKKEYRDFWGRRRVPALSNFSLEIRAGEVVGLVGRNGSGKTTALKCLLGLIRPTQGDVEVLSGDPRDPAVRRQVGYVPEKTDLNPLLTPVELFHYHGRLLGVDPATRRKRTDELLSKLDLQRDSRRQLRRLSLGTARRTALGVALMNEPKVLFLDEPLSAVDPEGVARFRDLLMGLKGRGAAILLSSHILSHLPDIADRILFLHDGEIKLSGGVDEILKRDEGTRLALSGLSEGQVEEVIREIRARGGKVEDVGPGRRSLESLYLEIVGSFRAEGEDGP